MRPTGAVWRVVAATALVLGIVAGTRHPVLAQANSLTLLFTRLDSNGVAHVWISDVQGQRQVVSANSSFPVWTPDRAQFLYENNDGNDLEIHRRAVSDTTGQTDTQLTNNTVADEWAAVSPDGKQFAWSQNFQLSVAQLSDGSGAHVISNLSSPATEHWSPCPQIALTAGQNADLYIINPDGTGAHSITSGFGPEWSPDCQRIVYYTAGKIFEINADGSGNHQVFDTGTAVGRPSYTLDGQSIVYEINPFQPQGAQIRMVNRDGTADHLLIDNAFNPAIAPAASSPSTTSTTSPPTTSSPTTSLSSGAGSQTSPAVGSVRAANSGSTTSSLAATGDDERRYAFIGLGLVLAGFAARRSLADSRRR